MPSNAERAAKIHQAVELLIKSTRMHHRTVDNRMGNSGLHHSQRKMLMFLSSTGGATSQREIADKFEISPACVARTLKSLAADGYVSRSGAENDMRRNNVFITEKGAQIVEETQRQFDQIDQHCFEGFSDAQLDQLILLLEQLQINLREREPAAAGD